MKTGNRMNFNNSTRLMGIALMAVALMSVTSVSQNVFADNTGMSLTATAGGSNISVSGETASNSTDVTFTVRTPDGANVVAVDQVTPDAEGIFGTEFNCSNWKQDGLYTITAQQGNSSLYTIGLSIEVNGGVAAEASASDSSLTVDVAAAEEAAAAEAVVEEVSGLSITASAVEGSDTIGITGNTTKTNEDVTLTVTSPNGNIVSIDQLRPESNGDFVTDIVIGGQLWSQDGIYAVVAQQGNAAAFKDSVEVDILDGLVVPEFGTIAAMILAVAIISIIAISSKSRLSIIPRY
jgi:predicted secreted protein with PEFG-CTERM motif